MLIIINSNFEVNAVMNLTNLMSFESQPFIHVPVHSLTKPGLQGALVQVLSFSVIKALLIGPANSKVACPDCSGIIEAMISCTGEFNLVLSSSIVIIAFLSSGLFCTTEAALWVASNSFYFLPCKGGVIIDSNDQASFACEQQHMAWMACVCEAMRQPRGLLDLQVAAACQEARHGWVYCLCADICISDRQSKQWKHCGDSL